MFATTLELLCLSVRMGLLFMCLLCLLRPALLYKILELLVRSQATVVGLHCAFVLLPGRCQVNKLAPIRTSGATASDPLNPQSA